jgi:hypothetical protein
MTDSIRHVPALAAIGDWGTRYVAPGGPAAE